MKTSLFLVMASIVLALNVSAGENADAGKELEGTWIPSKAEMAGKPMPEEFLKKIVSLKLDAGKYEVQAESLDKGTYVVNASAKPKTIDVTGTEGPNVGRKIPAIYELQGDTLRICYDLTGATHPAEFKSLAGTKFFLVTYQRKKA